MPDEEYVSRFRDDLDLIPNESTLLRIISPGFIRWSEGTEPQFTDGAFQDQNEKVAREEFGLPGPCMSVIVMKVLTEKGKRPSDVLLPLGPTYGLASFLAGSVRERCEQGVQWDPREWPPGHAVVFSKPRRKKSGAMKNCISEISEWEIEPGQMVS